MPDYPEKARLAVLTGIAEPDAEPDEQFRYLFIPVRPGTGGQLTVRARHR